MATTGPGVNPLPAIAAYELQLNGVAVSKFATLVQAASQVQNVAAVLGGAAPAETFVVSVGHGSPSPALDTWLGRHDFTLVARSTDGSVVVAWNATAGKLTKLAKTTSGDIAQATFHCASLKAQFS